LNARPCAGRLLNGFDQLDIAFEQIVDQSAKVDAFGFGAFGEPTELLDNPAQTWPGPMRRALLAPTRRWSTILIWK